MKLIKPSFEILEQKDLFQHIELCGRTAYKSEDKITSDSAPQFVEMLIKREHGAVLEHGTIYLKIDITNAMGDEINPIGTSLEWKYKWNKYSEVLSSDKYCYITTNYRVLIENNWLEDLQYQCEPTPYHEKRISVKFTIDRGISHEFVRHRVFSFIQESTRYCNYSKDKFGNELTFIEPCYINKLCVGDELERNEESGYSNMFTQVDYIKLLESIENHYIAAIVAGLKPQEARMILPNSLKTELIMTGTTEQWKGFFKLRCAPDAHPQARELAIPLKEEFKLKQLV